MNSTRFEAPSLIVTARSRQTRLAQAALLFAAVLFGAVSCADSGITEPFTPITPVAGLKLQYDSVAPPEVKDAPSPTFSRAGATAPSFSASGAASLTNVTSIPFNPERGPFASQLPGCDDCTFGGLGGLPIGFAFNYYGTTYNSFWISSNGFIAFTRPSSNGCCDGRPLPLFDQVNNMIALAWTDLNPRPGQMSFETRGEAPSRRLIINYNSVALVREPTKLVTAQLILFEGTNAIELHTTSQPTSLLRAVTQGAENLPATEAAFVQGRVASKAFSLSNDAVRFSGDQVNAIPVALPGGNAGTAPNRFYGGVEGTAVNFAGSGVDLDNDQLTYSWDFNNDGQPDATTADATWSWVDDGTYSALLIVDDGRGGIGRARVDVVIANAVPQVNAGDDIRILTGETANLSGRFSDAGVNDNPWKWTWNIASQAYEYGNDTNDQTLPLLGSHRFCRAGAFPAKLTIVDKDGAAGSDELTITVDAQSVDIDISPSTINLNGNAHGMITVRIFSRAGLDATSINPNTVKLVGDKGRGTPLARTGGGLWHWNADADVNGDGLVDVVAGFRRDELVANGDLTLDTAELRLVGQVGECGDALGKAAIRTNVQAKGKSAASAMQSNAAPANP